MFLKTKMNSLLSILIILIIYSFVLCISLETEFDDDFESNLSNGMIDTDSDGYIIIKKQSVPVGATVLKEMLGKKKRLVGGAVLKELLGKKKRYALVGGSVLKELLGK